MTEKNKASKDKKNCLTITGTGIALSMCALIIAILAFGRDVREEFLSNRARESEFPIIVEQRDILKQIAELQKEAIDNPAGATGTAIVEEVIKLDKTLQVVEAELGTIIPMESGAIPARPTLTNTNNPPTSTPSASQTQTPTQTPSITISPSPTGTPTISPTLTPTIFQFSPLDEWSDERVTLIMSKPIFLTNWSYGFIGYHYAVGFVIDFENHSGETIILRYNEDTFSLIDNRGRSYQCEHNNGASHWGTQAVSTNIPNTSTTSFSVGCGRNQDIDINVTTFIFSIRDFSSLGDSDWIIEVPK